MQCSDSLLTSSSLHLAVTTANPHNPEITQTLTSQCNQCYSDFTTGILKVLLTITTGCIDCLTYTYIIQPYVH
jgi:hypothetical protein